MQFTSKLKRIAKGIVFRNYIPCNWSKTNNWGDALNPYIISRIGSKEARFESNTNCWKYLVIGSIVDKADEFTKIWGSGMIAPNAYPQKKPHSIHAVRGPLTRDILNNIGINAPNVYGDPALLLPIYYNPSAIKKWKLGVIPHYKDVNHPLMKIFFNDDCVRVIDICSGIEDFVNEVVSCQYIISSSLHGLICADSYKIPNRRILLSDKIIGGDFKFDDYYASVRRKKEPPIAPKYTDTPKSIISMIEQYSIFEHSQQLLEVCPFSYK